MIKLHLTQMVFNCLLTCSSEPFDLLKKVKWNRLLHSEKGCQIHIVTHDTSCPFSNLNPLILV